MATPAPSPAPFARAENKDERIGDVFLDARPSRRESASWARDNRDYQTRTCC